MWWRLTGAQTITFRAGHWLKVIICFSVLMLGNTEAEDEQKLGEKWCRKYKAKNEIICSCSHTVTTQKIKYSPTWIFHKTVRPQILQFLPFHFIFPHTDESLACRKTFLFNRNFLLYRNLLFLLSGVTFFINDFPFLPNKTFMFQQTEGQHYLIFIARNIQINRNKIIFKINFLKSTVNSAIFSLKVEYMLWEPIQ